ncbi:MAG: hypothetical protein V4857_00010 [Pseudomonadota bacterium]
MTADSLPRDIMRGISWSFIGNRFADVHAFTAVLDDYQAAIDGKGSSLDTTVLPCARVLVLYRNGGDDDGVLELKAGNGVGFTARELLFQIHNGIVDEVCDLDHHFFEGLSLNSYPVAGYPPVFKMRLGS